MITEDQESGRCEGVNARFHGEFLNRKIFCSP